MYFVNWLINGIKIESIKFVFLVDVVLCFFNKKSNDDDSNKP